MRAPPESFSAMIGAPVLEGHRLHFYDLAGVGEAQRSTEDREVVGVDVHRTPVDLAVSGDDPVARNFLLLHVVVRAAVRDEFIEFHEGALVEQRLNAFAGGHSAGLMLFFDFSGSAAEFSGFVFREEIF